MSKSFVITGFILIVVCAFATVLYNLAESMAQATKVM
jgi:hypothetical protein